MRAAYLVGAVLMPLFALMDIRRKLSLHEIVVRALLCVGFVVNLEHVLRCNLSSCNHYSRRSRHWHHVS